MNQPDPPSRLTAALADRYRLQRELGQGGMATVYLARDLKHERDVAIKVLRPELAAVIGEDRFLTEIRTTAALQHPHILPLFDSGAADSFLYYVMPFVEGITLRDRMQREKQLPIEEATRIATEVASALHSAHKQGVIHRDIKPENILLHDGSALVADFGIALAASKAGGRMTETGMSLGTPQYMSPEQAMGERELDARSDVYALGCVLYEMLTGEPPFSGPTAQAIVAKVMTAEPAEATSLRKTIPPHVAHVVHTALQKLPADRFESAAALAAALADRQFTSAVLGAAPPARPAAQPWLRDPRSLAALVAVVALGALAIASRGPAGSGSAPATLRVSVPGPADSTLLSMPARPGPSFAEPVVSPDGRYLAFTSIRAAGNALYVRALDDFEPREIEGGGHWPFFAPDGSALGFFRERELWTVALPDGAPARTATLLDGGWDQMSAVWHPDGSILLSAAQGVWEVPATGGEPRLLIASDSGGLERFDELAVLPDGRVLIGITGRNTLSEDDDGADRRSELVSRDGVTREPITPGLVAVRVVDDIMLFEQAGQVRASFYDPRTLAPRGATIPIADLPTPRAGRSIAWVEGEGSRVRQPVWVSRDGQVTPLNMGSDRYRWPRLSPDGRQLAIGVGDTRRTSLQVYDLERGTRTRLGGATEPTWTSDGRQVIASSGSQPYGGLVRQPGDGSRPPDSLLQLASGDIWPTDVSPDGQWLAAYGTSLGASAGSDETDVGDLLMLELASRELRRLRLPGEQRGGRFSPDGRWLAYQSNESGTVQVHLRPWPDFDANVVVSDGTGTEPTWSRDGRELFYRAGNAVFAVPLEPRDGGLQPGLARELFRGTYMRDPWSDQSYDVASDGRFLMLRPLAGERIEIRVALHWIDEVRARLEAAQ